MEATSRDVTRKNAEAAEQNLQKAAEDLRGTMGRSAETVSDVADASPSDERAGGRTTRPDVGDAGQGRPKSWPAAPSRTWAS